jgi:1-pyrroline-5-carboxylate dehydrogenase
MTLPRVTYSNIGTDFSGVHDRLDRELPAFRQRLLGRDWADGRSRYDVASPIDRRIAIGTFGSADAGEVAAAQGRAEAAFRDWRRLPWPERVARLRAAAARLEERKWELAAACLLEVGKSRIEAMGEAEEAVDLIRYYCDEMEANEGYARPLRRAFEREETRDVLHPLGVFAVIAPFNFPLALSVNMITGALLAGNTVVFKPSPQCSLTGWLLVEALGLPKNLLNLVLGGRDVGRALVEHPGIAGVAFTGSHAAGMEIWRKLAAGPHAKPVIVEMGGKNPTYITGKADLDTAAAGVARSAFGLQGQKCSACSIAYVEESVAPAFLERLADFTKKLPIGDPQRREIYMGPVIDARAGDRFATAADAARRDGRIVFGGDRLSGGIFDEGAYVAPTVVADLAPQHRLNKEELFLPFLSVQVFRDLGEAIRRGNDVVYGLTAGVYTKDDAELTYFLDHAEAGVLYANRASGATTGAWPGIQSFGGWKGSGSSGKSGLGPYYVQQFLREQSQTVVSDDEPPIL